MHSSRMRTVRSSSRLAGGGCLAGGCLPGGVCPGGVSAPVHSGIHIPLMNRMTDRCKNMTLPELRCGRYLLLSQVTVHTHTARDRGRGQDRERKNIMHVCLHVLNKAPLLARAFVLLFYAIDQMT